jgi:hypothetical protein
MDFWPFIRRWPNGVANCACKILEQGFREVETLEKLKESGSDTEKYSAAEQLEKLGVPENWFRERLEKQYPGYAEAQTAMLFAFAARATL